MNLLGKLPSSLERSIPIALMGILALLSFSLLKSSPTVITPTTTAPNRVQIDYYLHQFSTAQLKDTGELKSFIRGQYAEHSPNDQLTSVKDFLFASSSKNNLYKGQSHLADFSDDANELTLRQNAVILKTPIKERVGDSFTKLTSQSLIYSQYPEIVISETPVNIEQSNRTIYAKSMRYNADEQLMRLSGSVRIVTQPKK